MIQVIKDKSYDRERVFPVVNNKSGDRETQVRENEMFSVKNCNSGDSERTLPVIVIIHKLEKVLSHK